MIVTKHVYFHLLVLPEFDCLDEGLERKFTNALVLVVVPQQHFVHGELGVRASAHQGQDVAPEEHLNDSDASVELYKNLINS